MASKRAVASALDLLRNAFAGTVDDAKVRVFHAALEGVDDDMLKHATAYVIRTHTGEFIPPPAVLIAAASPAPVAVDSTSVLHQVKKVGVLHETAGYCAPSVDAVRVALGAHIAYAYAAAGGPDRVFSESDVSRDIAARDFQKALTDSMRRPFAPLPILGGNKFGGLTMIDARNASSKLLTGATARDDDDDRRTRSVEADVDRDREAARSRG